MAHCVSDEKEQAIKALRNQLKQRLAQDVANAFGPRPVERQRRPQHLNLSGAQQRLWYLDQAGAGAAYNLTLAVRLRGKLDHKALRLALDAIVHRHEILRTVFSQIEGEPIQLVRPSGGWELRQVDLRQQTCGEERIAQMCTEEARTPIALDAGPPIRGQIILIENEDHVLLLTVHHIAFDGWSRGILMRELIVLYEAFKHNRGNPLPVVPLQYADYVLWQQAWMQSDAFRQQLNYWRGQLSDAPLLLPLPTDRPRPASQSYRGDSINFAVGVDLTSNLRTLARHNDASLFIVLQAAYVIVLSRLSGQNDIVIGTPVANRRWKNMEGMIGCFVNSLALRARLQDDLTVTGLIQQLKNTTLEALHHQDVPFEKLIEILQPIRSFRHSPVFQVLLGLQNTPQGEMRPPNLSIDARDVRGKGSFLDLSLMLQEEGNDITASLIYATDLFDRRTVEHWADYFKNVLAEIVRDSSRRVSAVPLAPLDERILDKQLVAFDPEGLLELMEKMHRSVIAD